MEFPLGPDGAPTSSSIQLIEFNLEIACGAVQMEFGNVSWVEYSRR